MKQRSKAIALLLAVLLLLAGCQTDPGPSGFGAADASGSNQAQMNSGENIDPSGNANPRTVPLTWAAMR